MDSGSTKGPLLGSDYVKAPPTPATVNDVGPTVCESITMFKDLMRQYRSLDDSIMIRLNRNSAFYRTERRSLGNDEGATRAPSPAAEEECKKFWVELMNNWTGREAVIRYCVSYVDTKALQKRKALDETGGTEQALDASRRSRELRDELYSEEVKRQAYHNELRVESIIRKRTLDAFKSRCSFFTPAADLPRPPVELEDPSVSAQEERRGINRYTTRR